MHWCAQAGGGTRLDHLDDEFGDDLVPVGEQVCLEGGPEFAAISDGELDAWEQIRQEGHEERQVKVDELRLDQVQHGAVHDDLLRGVRVRTLQRAGGAGDGDDEGAQPVVIVILQAATCHIGRACTPSV